VREIEVSKFYCSILTPIDNKNMEAIIPNFAPYVGYLLLAHSSVPHTPPGTQHGTLRCGQTEGVHQMINKTKSLGFVRSDILPS